MVIWTSNERGNGFFHWSHFYTILGHPHYYCFVSRAFSLPCFFYLSQKRDTVKIACSVIDVTTSWWHQHGCPVHTDNEHTTCGWSACTLMSPWLWTKDKIMLWPEWVHGVLWTRTEMKSWGPERWQPVWLPLPVGIRARWEPGITGPNSGLIDYKGGHASHRVHGAWSFTSVPGCVAFSKPFHL